MRMSKQDITDYPRLAHYVKYRMPEVAGVPLIVKNMKKYGSLSKADLVTAIGWGGGPLIVVKSLSNYECVVQAAYGCFDPSNPTQIEIDIGYVKIFEQDANGAGRDTNSKGKKVYVIGATILHELCHWGNHKKSVVEKTKQGLAFEKATYGNVIG